MTTLARALQARNHDVVFISLPDGELSVRAAGLTFVPCAVKEFAAGSLKERFRQRSSSRERKRCGLYYRMLPTGQKQY
jgi:zeaxanthin glucosyltransferase